MCKMAYRSKQFGPYIVRPAPPYRPAKGGKTMLRTLFRDDNNLAGLLIKFYSRFHDSRICFIEFYPIIIHRACFRSTDLSGAVSTSNKSRNIFPSVLLGCTVNIRLLT